MVVACSSGHLKVVSSISFCVLNTMTIPLSFFFYQIRRFAVSTLFGLIRIPNLLNSLIHSSHYITIQRIWTEYQCLELVGRMAL